MALKKIIVLFNGTGNGDKDGTENKNKNTAITNVVKMRDGLIKDESQFVIYRDGIGNDQQWHWKPLRYFSEVTGYGGGWVMDHAYADLMTAIDNAIKNQLITENDSLQVYLGGFSRGAALARHFGNEYINKKFVQEMQHKLPGVQITLESEYLFDTVPSFGIPINLWIGKLFGINNQEIDLGYNFDIPDTTRANHAVAIDEHRDAFNPRLVDHVEGMTKEVWFDGDHSSIGGGYKPAQESEVMGDENPLRFMVGCALDDGIRFEQSFLDAIHINEQVHPLGHIETPERKNLPPTQRIDRKICLQEYGKRSDKAPTIARSVLDRIQSESYRPENVAALNRFDIREEDGNLSSFSKNRLDEPWDILAGPRLLQFTKLQMSTPNAISLDDAPLSLKRKNQI